MVNSTISYITRRDKASLRRRVGAALRAARLARGMTQGQLAGPYTAAFVSRIEHGDAIPSLSSLEVLTAKLSISLEEFFRTVERVDLSGDSMD